MNLSAEAVPCLSEVSASDKRWGQPPLVTDRPASWRLRTQSNHATRKGPALCSWSVTLWAGGSSEGAGGRGGGGERMGGGGGMDDKPQPFVSTKAH